METSLNELLQELSKPQLQPRHGSENALRGLGDGSEVGRCLWLTPSRQGRPDEEKPHPCRQEWLEPAATTEDLPFRKTCVEAGPSAGDQCP